MPTGSRVKAHYAGLVDDVLQGGYYLQDTGAVSEKPASEIRVDVLNPLLGLVAPNGQGTLPTALNTPHLDVQLYTVQGEDPSGTYIVVWRGKDGHGVEYRDLKPHRMVPLNVRPRLTARQHGSPRATWMSPSPAAERRIEVER